MMKKTGYLVLGLTCACALTWLAVRQPSTATTERITDATEGRRVSDEPEKQAGRPKPRNDVTPTPPRDSRRERDRVAHQDRIAKIRRAHESHNARDEIGPCNGGGCARVGEEIRDILQGCREESAGTKGRVTLTANVLAAPETGTVVESVTLTGEGASDALRECLVESMYTLDLGEPQQAFAEQVQVFFGGGIKLNLGATSDPKLLEAGQELAAYDNKADAAVEDGVYIISQGPIPAGPDE